MASIMASTARLLTPRKLLLPSSSADLLPYRRRLVGGGRQREAPLDDGHHVEVVLLAGAGGRARSPPAARSAPRPASAGCAASPRYCAVRGTMYSTTNGSPLGRRSLPSVPSLQPASSNSARALSRFWRRPLGLLAVLGATKAGPKTRGGNSARNGSSSSQLARARHALGGEFGVVEDAAGAREDTGLVERLEVVGVAQRLAHADVLELGPAQVELVALQLLAEAGVQVAPSGCAGPPTSRPCACAPTSASGTPCRGRTRRP